MSEPNVVSSKGQATTGIVDIDDDVQASFAGSGPTDTVQPQMEDTVFSAAQRGDLALVRQLIESGQASAAERDSQNITPLHWAAINAHLSICRYLLEQGAEVDVIGGELLSTPLQWAARSGHLYVLQLLISYNADPTIRDSQGYDTLQLVTHSSNVMSLLYILQQPVSINSRDLQSHTPLMWAAYQGDAISVDILLAHGADSTLKDEKGMTALHWGVVKANKSVIRRVVEADPTLLQARDDSGKTPKELSESLKSYLPFKNALEEGNWAEESGLPKRRPVLNEKNTKMVILALPTICLGAIFKTFEILPWWTALPLAGAEFFAMHHVVTKVLLAGRPTSSLSFGPEGGVTNSPYCAGIITGSMVWLGWTWFGRIVYNTPGYAVANLLFALLFMLCAYNFFRAITLDPGYCPHPTSDEEKKLIIENLASSGRLNGQTFCVACMAQKPLRSKHCRHCGKCVARHDHHCPWVWNCVGVNNHRQFLVFVTTLVLGIMVFDYLCYGYFTLNMPGADQLTSVTDVFKFFSRAVSDTASSLNQDGVRPINPGSTTPPAESDFCLLPSTLCAFTQWDTFLSALIFWVNLQLPWTFLLLATQVWQVTRQMTTYEVSNLGRYGWMGGRGTSLQGQMGAISAIRANATPGMGGEDDEVLPTAHGHAHGHGHGHRHGRGSGSGSGSGQGISSNLNSGRLGFLMKLMGLDRFTQTRAREGLVKSAAASGSNPFDLGCIGNCRDFWSTGREVGVEYERLYDVPQEGFREAKRRRRERLEEEGLLANDELNPGGGRKGFMGMSMGGGWGSMLGRSNREGYAPVRMEETV